MKFHGTLFKTIHRNYDTNCFLMAKYHRSNFMEAMKEPKTLLYDSFHHTKSHSNIL